MGRSEGRCQGRSEGRCQGRSEGRCQGRVYRKGIWEGVKELS